MCIAARNGFVAGNPFEEKVAFLDETLKILINTVCSMNQLLVRKIYKI
jgi:hypothetical protein